MFGFLIKNPKHGLVYTGKIEQYDKLVDSADAESRFKRRKGGNFEEVSVNIYGETKKFVIPVADEKDLMKCKVISTQFNEFIREKARYKLFSDISLGYWDEFLKKYECVVNPEGWICFFDLLGEKKDIELKSIEEKADFVMLREYMGGYVRVNPYMYHYKDGAKRKVEPINLHIDYDTGGLGIQIKNNYTTNLRNAMFGKMKEMFETDSLLQPRQYDVLEKMGQKSYICGPRRSGKTYLSAFLCIREIMRESFDIRTSGRPIQVIYIANKSEVFNSVVSYIKGMCKSLGNDFDSMFWRDTTTVQNGKVLNFGSGDDVLGRIIFISAKADGAGLGHFADLIIIDEAGEVPERVYKNIIPIVLNERAKLVCISTMYKHALKGWFFDKIIESEKRNVSNLKQETLELYKNKFHGLSIKSGENNKVYNDAVNEFYKTNDAISLRYTIDDISFLEEWQKDSIKLEAKKDYIAYLCELYSRFVDAGRLFDYETSIIEKVSDIDKYQYIVLGYDPASMSDKPGAVVIGYDNVKKMIVVLYSDYLNSDTGQYQEQVQQVIPLKKEYKKYLEYSENIYSVADSTQGGTIDAFEISGFTFDRRYRWTSGNDVVDSKKVYGEVKIPKKVMIDVLEHAFINNLIAIPQKMSKLINELENYQRIQHTTGRLEFGGVGCNDDIVSALLMAVYYLYNELGVKFEVSDYRETALKQNMTQEEIIAYLALKKSEEELRKSMTEYDKARSKYFSTNVF